MANKRQRKKQQAKRNIEILQKAGVSRKEIKQIKNKPAELIVKRPEVKQYKKRVKQQERNARAASRSDFLKTLTDDKDLIRRMRYWSDDRYQEEVKRLERNKKARERYRQKKEEELKTPGRKLVMLWKDKTEYNNYEFIMDSKRSMSHDTISQLLHDINYWRTQKFGEIGEHLLILTTNPRETISYYTATDRGMEPEYIPVYSGNGVSYKHLLVAIATMMLGLYQPHEKEMFLIELVQMLNQIHPKNAQRLAKDLEIERF